MKKHKTRKYNYHVIEHDSAHVFGIVETIKNNPKSYSFDWEYIKEAVKFGKRKKIIGRFVKLFFYPHWSVEGVMILHIWDGHSKRMIAISGRDD